MTEHNEETCPDCLRAHTSAQPCSHRLTRAILDGWPQDIDKKMIHQLSDADLDWLRDKWNYEITIHSLVERAILDMLEYDM